MFGFTLPLRFALPFSFMYTWRGWWRGYPAYHVTSCLPCNIIVIIIMLGIRWWMQVHHRARGFTHSGHNSNARLDSDDWIPFLHRYWVGAGSGNHSDQLPLLCSLLPRVAPVSLHPQRRAPTAVLEPADLMERLTVWIKRTVEVHLPLTDEELVSIGPLSRLASGKRPEPNFKCSPPVLAL
jgi:hypothetical protein